MDTRGRGKKGTYVEEWQMQIYQESMIDRKTHVMDIWKCEADDIEDVMDRTKLKLEERNPKLFQRPPLMGKARGEDGKNDSLH